MANVESLTVQQLRCFVAVADEGQFTRAAEQLEVAQPSLSAQIGRLEQALGVSLFYRAHRPVTLTDAGVELLPLARRVLGSVNDVLRGVADVEALRRGQVTVGATPSLGSSLLPRVLSSFHQHYPEIALTVVERHSDDLASQLESGTLDVAVAILPMARDTLEVTVLAVEELCVIVAPDHPLARRQRDPRRGPARRRDDHVPRGLRPALHDDPRVRARRRFAPTIGLDGAEVGSVHAYVAAGLGAAVVPSIVAAGAPGVRTLRLTPRLERTIGLVRPAQHAPTRAAAALIDELTSMVARGEWPATDERLVHAVPAKRARAAR